jgi:glutamine synthetase
MGDLAINHILPAAVVYQNLLIENIRGLKEAGLPESSYCSQTQILKQISEHVQGIYTNVNDMIKKRKIANNMTETRSKAIAYCNEVKESYFDTIRYHADKLEVLVNDEQWQLPKYRELLFLR